MFSDNFASLLLYPVLLAVPVLLAGCTPSATTPVASEDHDHDHDEHADHDHDEHDEHGEHAGHDHEHGETGPHDGHLIELGHDHEYHAELTHDEATESVLIYVLDAHLEPLPIQATSVMLTANGPLGAQLFELAAIPELPGHGASKFASQDPQLIELIESGDEVECKLRVMIAGVPYSGELAHAAHEHEGH